MNTLESRPQDLAELAPSTCWAPSSFCECGAVLIRRKSGEMLCEKTAKTYEAKYGQKLE